MKLYTEEQVKKAISIAEYGDYECEQIIDELTPIELPSDEEIEESSPIVNINAHDYYFGHKDGFIEGAKWMKEQLLGKEDKTFKQKSKWIEVDNIKSQVTTTGAWTPKTN
jgi:hypothetical protein